MAKTKTTTTETATKSAGTKTADTAAERITAARASGETIVYADRTAPDGTTAKWRLYVEYAARVAGVRDGDPTDIVGMMIAANATTTTESTVKSQSHIGGWRRLPADEPGSRRVIDGVVRPGGIPGPYGKSFVDAIHPGAYNYGTDKYDRRKHAAAVRAAIKTRGEQRGPVPVELATK